MNYGIDQCWADITFLRYSWNKNIHLSFIHWIRIYFYFILKKLCILAGYQIFTFFNSIRASMLKKYFSFIYKLDMSRSGYQKFKNLPTNYARCQSFSSKQKISKRQYPFLKRKYLSQIFFFLKKNSQKKIHKYSFK